MMWRTIDGLRIMRGQEAELLRRVIDQMLNRLVDEIEHSTPMWSYGVDWFDQWDTEQRVWLLEQVAASLFLEQHEPMPPAAMYEATVDAIFCCLMNEIDEEIKLSRQIASEDSWRQGLIAAFECQQNRLPTIERAETEIHRWFSLASQVAESILGHSSYLQAETFRDADARILERFLRGRALPYDYLQRIPPLRTDLQTQSSVKAIRDLLKR